MGAIRFVVLWFSLCLGALAAASVSHAQTLPLQGPGLGNLTYTDAELFREISIIDWNRGTYTNGMPAYHPPANQDPKRAYGINVAIMVNGYMLTAFAPDGGYPTGGWLLYDVSNPRDIKLKKTVYDPSGTTKDFREPHSLGAAVIDGKTYVVMSADTGVEFWDFTDINDIKRVKKLVLGEGYPNNFDYDALSWQLYWQAPYVYVASSGRGMHIIDARDPANAKLADRGGRPNPIPIGSLGGFRLGPIFAMGNQLLLSSMETTTGFASLDISDPLNPVLVNSKATLPLYYATCFNGKKLYSSGRNAAGKIGGYDLTDVRNIVTENETASPVEGLYCATQDNNLFIGAQRHVFKYDVSNPASYPELGRTERVADPTFIPPLAKTDPDLGQVTLFGNLVFVGGDHGHDTAFRPHQKTPDTTKPVVIASSPANNAQQQAVTSRIGFGLSDNILLDTINATNFIVRVKGGAQVAGVYSAQLGMINFAPTLPLQFNTEYEAVLKANGVKDYAGNAIAQDYVLTFRTGGSATFVNRWPLNSSLVDVGSGNNGVASSADRYAEGGLDFSNRTTGVQLGSNAVAEVLGANATVTFRMKTTQVGTTAPWTAPGLFGRDQSPGGSDVFWGWIDNQGFLNMSVGNSGTSNPGTKSNKRINDGVWHEIAISRNSDTGAQAIYVDGVRTTSNSAAGVLGLSNKLQMLGQIQGNPVAFNGILSDVRIYNRVLSDGEVAAVFKPETGSANVNRWPLTVSLTDVVGGNNGTASGADVYSDGGLDFTNRTTGVQLASDSIADTLGGTATVSFRMKTTQVGTANPWTAPGIFGRDQAGGGSDVFWGWIDAQGFLNLSVANVVAGNPGTKSNKRINDGLWHEIALVRNSNTGKQTIYVDGVVTTTNSASGVLGLTNKMQWLGQIQGNPVAYKGILSDVRVYNRDLTTAEIGRIFNPDQSVLTQRQVGQAVSIDPATLGLSGAQYIWNFGDGSPPLTTTSANPVVNYTYRVPGNYTISITVVAPDGSQTPHAFIQSVINPVTATQPVHTSNIVGNSTHVYALDPDAGTLAQIDATSLVKNWQISLGKEPKTLAFGPNGWLWATVQGDDKFVKIDPVTRAVTTYTLDYGSGPYGILFTPNGAKGILTLASKSQIAIFDPATGAITNRITLPDGDLRGIAISGDSSTAYVTRFRSKMARGEVYKVNLASPTAAVTIALPVDTVTQQTEASAPGVANYANQVVISPDGLRAVLPSKKDNIVDGRFRNQKDLKHDTTVRSILSQVNLSTGAEVFAEQIDFNNRAPARAALFTPSGNYIFVAQMESNSVEIVDTYRRVVVATIIGSRKTPHGLYLHQASKRLFVNNFLDRNVTVHDVSKVLTGSDFITPVPTVVSTVQTEPLTASVLAGKKIFYNAEDPRMSRERYMSCASCHVDGDSDGMVWDFTQRGEGLRRTISLQGRQGLGGTPTTSKLHWTANFDELQDFEKDIRLEFGGAGFMSDANYNTTINPLGPKKAGLSADLDNLAAYVTSLNTFPRSPFKTAQGCLTSAAVTGQQIFTIQGCATCHVNAVSQDNARHDVGTVQASSGTGSGAPLAGVGFDTPGLYGLWQSSSFFHNGQAATMMDAFNTPAHGGGIARDSIDELVTYVQSLDGGAVCTAGP